MIIVNADDYGYVPVATDRILACHSVGGVTDASAMVFMEDAERAASQAAEAGLETGLHLNLTQAFTAARVPTGVRERHERVARYLNGSRLAPLIYHPLLAGDVRYLFECQLAEYRRLYSSEPTHLDGHHHMHLCANMLFSSLVPAGWRLRRNFSFTAGEKSWFNRTYRAWVDRWIARRHIVPDYLFSFSMCSDDAGLARVLELGRRTVVEVETHPEWDHEFHRLLNSAWVEALASVGKGSYSRLGAHGTNRPVAPVALEGSKP